MKAFGKIGIDEYAFKELSEPQIVSPDDVKIRVKYTTICSDEYKSFGLEDFFSSVLVAGHEMSGIIVDLGENAKEMGFNIGDNVSGIPYLFCGKCQMCKSGNENSCIDMNYSVGTLCKYIVWKYKQLVKVPDGLSMKTACLAEPLASVIQGLEKADIRFSDSVIIFGAGFSGLMFTKFAKLKGAASITVVDPIEERRNLALKYGADFVMDSNEHNFEIKLSKRMNFVGFNKVIETSGSFLALENALNLIARGGTLLVDTYYGIYHKTQINMTQLYIENLNICGTFLYNNKIDIAMQMLPKLGCEEIISLELPFTKAQEAYTIAKQNKHIKIAIKL